MENAEIEKLIEEVINNLEEDLHSHIEIESIPHLESLKKRNASLFHDDIKYMDFCHFLTIQYVRTNKIKQNLVRGIGDLAGGYIERALGVLRHIYATNIAWSIYEKKHSENLKPTLLLNNTSKNFITGDQPIINTHAVKSGYAEIVRDVELYYPISPNTSLIISKNYFSGMDDQVEVNEGQVDYFNNLIAASAEEQIFGIEETDLEPYIHKITPNG